MKKLTKIVAALLATVLLVTLPSFQAITARAEANSYVINAIDGKWRFQEGNKWDDVGYNRELYYLFQQIKDGDILVVVGNDAEEIKFDVKLNNITFAGGSYAVIFAKGVENVYFLSNSSGSVNANVDNCYAYDTAVGNVNGNIGYLECSSETDDLDVSFSTSGTVGYAYCHSSWYYPVKFYDFKAGTFALKHGSLQTAESDYSKTGAEGKNVPGSIIVTAPAPAAPAAPAKTDSGKKLDSVPKTGESPIAVVLGLMGLLLLGASTLLKKNNQ